MKSGRPLVDLFRIGAAPALCVLALAAAGLAGCASTAPRFRPTPPERRERPAEPGEPPGSDLGVPPVPAIKPRPWEDAPLPPGLNRDHVLLEIVSLLGVPYAYGGGDREGMDCSSFTGEVYAKGLSMRLPRSTADQYREGTEVPRDRLRFGDLVFFNTTGESPSHVGIYIEDDLFAHASVSIGVTISSMESPYYRDRFVGARRIIN